MTRSQMNLGLLLLAGLAVGCTTTQPTAISGPEETTVEPVTTTTTSPATSEASSTSSTPSTTFTTTTTPESYPGESSGGCRPDPFAGSVAADLANRYPGRDLTAHIFDIRTGCEYSLNPGNRQNTASVFKVMVMAGTLLEAQNRERDVTGSEMSRLVPMITESANWPVRSLWHSFGASPWFREVAFGLMTSVVPDQTWGVTAGVPPSWTVAQKNGFAGRIINSVGWVDPPGEDDGYLVAILTYGLPHHPAGRAAVPWPDGV